MKFFTPKLLIALCIVCCASVRSDAQYPKYIVQFADKKNSPYTFDKPLEYLSQKAVQRRTRYSIAIDSSDLPVNPSYIQQVVAQGPVTYLSQAKWLNQILIYCTSNATINLIRGLPFVKSVSTIGPSPQLQPSPNDKFKIEKATPLTESVKVQREPSTNVFNYGNSYNQIHIHNGEFLHNKGFTGKGVTIAIIDAGFYHYRTIKAFDSTRSANRFLGERDFVDFDNSVNEDDSHGEYCLSTIASNVPGIMVGTAPHAKFWLLRGENIFSEYPIEEHNWVAAAAFADSAGADLITSSLGYFQFDDASFNHTYNDFYKNTTIVSKGATYAAKKGMIVTNSAGNEGASSWKYLIFPADDDSVCAVGATNSAGQIAYFSSYGYPGKVKPNIVSVGDNTVVYTSFGVSTASGTSFSNPNINGLIACLWQAFPKFNNATILKAVYRSSDRFGNPDNRYGYGIPNMQKAYRILKALQNHESLGNDWLFATLDETSHKINVKLIGRVDGAAALKLLNSSGAVLSTIKLNTEEQEVYDKAFTTSSFNSGKFIVQYSDASVSRSIELKIAAPVADWLQALPVPFQNKLTVQLRAPETGKIIVRLTNANGNTIESKELNVVQGNLYQIKFSKSSLLNKGVYYIQYKGLKESKTIKAEK